MNTLKVADYFNLHSTERAEIRFNDPYSVATEEFNAVSGTFLIPESDDCYGATHFFKGY